MSIPSSAAKSLSVAASHITHQRRPAIIPANVRLSLEDEQSVRMRTGCVNPLSRNEIVFFDTLGAIAAVAEGNREARRKSEQGDTLGCVILGRSEGLNGNGKRKRKESEDEVENAERRDPVDVEMKTDAEAKNTA